MKCKNCGSKNLCITRISGNDKTVYDIICKSCDYEYMLSEEEYETETSQIFKKLLVVEDGSIDIDRHAQDLSDMGIKLLIYRQGAEPPRLYDLKD